MSTSGGAPSQGLELSNWCFRVRDAGEKALNKVLPVIRTSPISISAYAIKGRTKTKQDVFDKVLRKRADKNKPQPAYEPSWVTDVAGIRVVTLFQPDIVNVVDYMLKMIRLDQSVTARPFVKDGLREVRILTNRPDKDPLSIANRVHEVVKAAGFGSVCHPPEDSESGYSSVHLIATTEVELEGEDNRLRPFAFPLEIQIRNVFEDAWGEIDHKLRYRDKRKAEQPEPDKRVRTWAPHLNALKTYIDGCSQYADVIKEQAIDLGPEHDTPPIFNPIETVQEALQEFANHPESIQQKMRQAYAARERLERAVTLEDKAQFAAETVEVFERIQKDEQAFLQLDNAQARTLSYYIRMERAYGLMELQQADCLATAIQLYEGLGAEFPDDPSIYYRWGQALALADRQNEAIAYFERGMRALGTDRRSPVLRSALPRSLAFHIWRLSERAPNLEAKMELLSRAYDLAVQAIDASTPGSVQESMALNAAIYYSVEHNGFATTAQKGPIPSDKAKFSDYVTKLEASLHVRTSTNRRRLDTLCRAYVFLGRKHDAAVVGERVIAVMEKLDPAQFSNDDLDMLKFAQQVVAERETVAVSTDTGS